MNPIPLFRPSYGPREKELVCQAIDSGWTGLGPMTEKFEVAFAHRMGVKHAVMTNSATAALELALLAHGVGPGKRVAVPTMTFVATAHAVRNVGAEVVLCDVLEDTLLLDWAAAETRMSELCGPDFKDAWFLPVLYAGQDCTNPYYGHARDRTIYDCAHACGSSFDARGKTCCWSFHAVKNLACGEGGMLTTDDDAIADKVRRMRWLGVSKSTYERTRIASPSEPWSSKPKTRQVYSWEYEVTWPGRKAHGNDLAAAMGLAQLEWLDEMQEKRKYLWSAYREYLGSKYGFQSWLPGHSYLLAVLRHPRRDELGAHLSSKGIGWGVHYKCLHLTDAYREHQGQFPVADRVWRELLTLPLYPDMTVEDQDRVIQAVRSFHA
jgi:perosamine synthetase